MSESALTRHYSKSGEPLYICGTLNGIYIFTRVRQPRPQVPCSSLLKVQRQGECTMLSIAFLSSVLQLAIRHDMFCSHFWMYADKQDGWQPADILCGQNSFTSICLRTDGTCWLHHHNCFSSRIFTTSPANAAATAIPSHGRSARHHERLQFIDHQLPIDFVPGLCMGSRSCRLLNVMRGAATLAALSHSYTCAVQGRQWCLHRAGQISRFAEADAEAHHRGGASQAQPARQHVSCICQPLCDAASHAVHQPVD
jgi:hypothetical protein